MSPGNYRLVKKTIKWGTKKIFNYRGNIHIHSTHSDGTATIPEIAAFAEGAGLDYIIITDHHHNRETAEEGFYRGVAVLLESELNEAGNHYLAMDTKDAIPPYTANPQKSIDAVNEQGGFGFLAHPCETGSPIIQDGACFPWRDWSVEGFQGLELWNYCSQWRGRALSPVQIILWYFLDLHGPAKSGAPLKALEKWDELTRSGAVVAIGGGDNHAAMVRLGLKKVKVFPYDKVFQAVNTHIVLPEPLSREFPKAKEQIYKALRAGNCFVSLDIYRGEGNFYFGAYNAEKEIIQGSSIDLDGETYLKINAAGKKSLIRIIRDGKLIFQRRERFLHYKVKEKGTYRVEIYRYSLTGKARPWIYSNPVYIKQGNR